MTTPVVTFFSTKGGVGKTMLVYHLAWMLKELGTRVVVLDLDPQANLTTSFISDERVEELWSRIDRGSIYGALAPLFEGEGGLGESYVEEIADGLGLVPGDLRLTGAEQELSSAWQASLDGQRRAFRVLTAFAAVARQAASQTDAELVLVDVGPNLGAINRAAMVASDHVVVPLAPDLFSLLGLQNLGPTLEQWRRGWADRLNHSPGGFDAPLPQGQMRPRGYVVIRHGTRVDRTVGAYDRRLQQVPGEYRRSVLQEPVDNPPLVADDEYCLGLLKHYHSLVPLAQEARKPLFLLRSADGAIGAHQRAVHDAYGHFEALTRRLLDVVGVSA